MAEGNNFILDLIASLQKSKSKKQVKDDIKNLGDIKVPLIGTLNKTKTRKQIRQDLKSLNENITLNAKVNQKSTTASAKQATQNAQKQLDNSPIQMNVTLKKDKLINDIKILGQQNSKLFKDSNMSSKYNSLLNNAQLATSSDEVQKLRLQLSAMRSELKATGLSGLNLGDTLRKTFKRATELFTGTGGVMLVIQQLRQAWMEALELDKAYTDLIKVQDELTRSDYPDYLDKVNEKTQKLATTQKELIEATTEFSKVGYNLTTSNALSEKSTVLSNVGEMNASDSAKAIISGVQAYDTIDGYDDVIDKAQALIDKYNEIGNTASITTAEIAEGVQSVGSVFSDANTSVDEFIALLAAGNRQFQDADSLALGLRTSALRIRGASAELEAIGEDTEGVITSVSKLEDKIKGLTNIDGSGGVKILEDDENTFRSIYDIYVDIGKVYSQMSDIDSSALLDLIAGKNRASAISATLNNISEAQEVYQNSLNSTGSAQKEYDKYLESSEASLNRFKSNMTETYQSVISGETTRAILDSGNAVVSFANDLGLVESTLKGFIAIGIVKAITTLSTAFKASAIQANNFGLALNTVKNMSSMTRNTTEYTNALNILKTASSNLSATQLKQVLASKALNDTERIAILRTTGLSKVQAQAKLAQMELTTSTKAQTTANVSATASTFSLTAAVKGFGLSLKAAFMANPVGISIMALSTIIGAVSSKVADYKQKIEETRQANIDAATSASDQASELTNLYTQYDQLNGIQERTSSQEEQLKTVIENITKAIGEKSEALSDLTIGTDEYTEALKNATKAELENQFATAKIGAKAAEDALKDKTWNSWDGSQITIQANEQMSGVKEHIAALNEVKDILSEYEDIGNYGIEWEPINWDSDKNNLNAVVEYYNVLLEARNKLVTSDDADFLMSSDIYENINSTINDLSESVETYTKQQYEALKLEYMWQNGIPVTESEFKSMEQSILNASNAGQAFQDILKGFMVQDFSSLSNSIDDVGNSLEAVQDKQETNSSPLGSLDTESLDKFQSSISSVKSALSDISSLDTSSIIDLIQNFSDFDWSDYGITGEQGVGDLEGALQALAKQLYDTAIATGGENDALKALYDEAVNASSGVTSLADAISNFENTSKLLEKVKEEIKEVGSITSSTLSTLASSGNKLLEDAVASYLTNGNVDVIINALQEAYQTDLDNYNSYMSAKLQTDDSFYQQILDGLSEDIKNKAKAYGVDLENFKNLAEAKAALETALINKLGNAWTNYAKHAQTIAEASMTTDMARSEKIYIKKVSDPNTATGKAFKEWSDITVSLNDVVADLTNNLDFSSGLKKATAATDKLGSSAEKAKEAIDELMEAFSDLKTGYDLRLNLYTDRDDKLQKSIDILKSQGEMVGEQLYEELISSQQKQVQILQQKKTDFEKFLADGMSSGIIAQGSKEWFEITQAIEDTKDEIMDCTASVEDFQNAINDLHWDKFDKFIERIKGLDTEINNIIDLLSRNDLVVDFTGEWTDEGITTLGLYGQAYESAQYQAKQYTEQIEYLTQAYNDGKYSQLEYQEKLQELTESQWDAIDAANKAKDGIVELNKARVDAIKNGIEEETSALEKLIKTRKEELDQQKNTRDFTRSVEDAEKEILTIQKKINALGNDDSKEANALRAKYHAGLVEANQKLEDIYYDESISKQQEALDKQLEDFKTTQQEKISQLEATLDNEEKLIYDSLETVKTNHATVYSTLIQMGNTYGIQLSSAITQPWLNGSNALSSYSSEFGSATSGFIDQLGIIKTNFDDMGDAADATASKIVSMMQQIEQAYNAQTAAANAAKAAADAASAAGASISSNSQATSSNSSNSETGTRTRYYYSVVGANGEILSTHSSNDQATAAKLAQDRLNNYWRSRRPGSLGVKLTKTEKYAKGVKNLSEDQLAWTQDPNGTANTREMIISPTRGVLTPLKRGDSVLKNQLTENVFGMAEDPSKFIMDNINLPQLDFSNIKPSTNLANNSISVESPTVIIQGNVDDNNIKNIQKQIDKSINDSLGKVLFSMKKNGHR